MNVIIGTAPCSWGVWWADGTPSNTPYQTFLNQAAEAGYEKLELGPDGYLPNDIVQLKEQLARRNLAVCAGTACYTFAEHRDFSEIKPRIDSLCSRIRALEANYLVAMDDSPIGNNREIKNARTNKDWTSFYRVLYELGNYTRNMFGIETVFHQHVGTLIETEEETVRVMEEAELALCFDTGHYAFINGGWERGDQSALDFMKKHASRIPYLHFKNVNGAVKKQIVEGALPIGEAAKLDIMCNLDEGIIDYNAFRNVLIELNFSGIAIVEQDVPNATTAEAFEIAKHNLRYLRQIHMIH